MGQSIIFKSCINIYGPKCKKFDAGGCFYNKWILNFEMAQLERDTWSNLVLSLPFFFLFFFPLYLPWQPTTFTSLSSSEYPPRGTLSFSFPLSFFFLLSLSPPTARLKSNHHRPACIGLACSSPYGDPSPQGATPHLLSISINCLSKPRLTDLQMLISSSSDVEIQ